MKIVQITAVQSKSDRADHIVYGLDENGEMWRSDNGHSVWEYLGGLPKECVVLPNVIGVFEPTKERLDKISKEYSEDYYKPITEWDGEDTREAYKAGYKQALQDMKEAQK